MKKSLILKTEINEIKIDDVKNQLLNSQGLSIALCNANSVVRAYKNPKLNNTLSEFDICTSDGFPIALAFRILYKKKQRRVDGFKLFNQTLIESEDKNITHYLFGNTEEVVEKIINKFKNSHPGINIIGYVCPPILEVDDLLDEKYISEIIKLKPSIVWVSLGFPKQEQFISRFTRKYQSESNFVGVGFTFDWTAGTKFKAPEFLANIGLEWLFRLVQEPRRLFKRYLIDNFLFIIYFIKQYRKK